MKPHVVLSAFACLLAAAAFALSLVGASSEDPLLSSQDANAFAPPSATESSGRTSRGGRGPGDVQKRLAALEQEVDVLRAEVRARRHRRLPTARGTGEAGTGGRYADVEGDPGEGENGERASPEAALAEALDSDPEVASRIDSLVESKLQADRDERWQRREARAAERDTERVERFKAAQKLDPEQAEKLATMIAAERQQIMAMMRSARESMDWRTARDQMQAVRDETDGNLEAVLDDDQFAGWQTVREEQTSFWRSGRRGGARRDGKKNEP